MNYLHWQKQFREALRTITDNFQINKKRKTLLEMSNETHREAGQLHHNMAKVERKTIWGRSPTCEGIELEFQNWKKKNLFKTRLHNMIHLTDWELIFRFKISTKLPTEPRHFHQHTHPGMIAIVDRHLRQLLETVIAVNRFDH